MRSRYKKEFNTRQAIVQAVYSNISEFNENFLTDMKENAGMFADGEIDEAVFNANLAKVLEQWNIFDITEYSQKQELSRCAIAILRAAKAELSMKKDPDALILNEYIEIAKLFAPVETKIINKILDSFILK